MYFAKKEIIVNITKKNYHIMPSPQSPPARNICIKHFFQFLEILQSLVRIAKIL